MKFLIEIFCIPILLKSTSKGSVNTSSSWELRRSPILNYIQTTLLLHHFPITDNKNPTCQTHILRSDRTKPTSSLFIGLNMESFDVGGLYSFQRELKKTENSLAKRLRSIEKDYEFLSKTVPL